MEKVLVDLNYRYGPQIMNMLEWVFYHCENNGTKLILTSIYAQDASWTKDAQDYYLPECRRRKFAAEMLLPIAKEFEERMMEFITKHQIKKLVMDPTWMSIVSKFFDDHRNLSCKVWYLDRLKPGLLSSIRGYGPDYDESSKKNADEDTISQLRSMSNEAKNEKDLLLQENKKLKENISHLKGKEESSKKHYAEKLNELRKMNAELCKIRAERDNAVKEAEKLRSMIEKAEILRLKTEVEKEESNNQLRKVNEELRKLQAERDEAFKEAQELRSERVTVQSSDFTLAELEEATDNFNDSLKISKGAYGCVYKGYLRGIEVAIKILNAQSTELVSAFKQEVAILTTARHPNLVTLIGACYEASALVYEFLPNGSLENHLNPANNMTPLTWQLRTRIICEICLALIFLHSNKPNMVIHGDLKPDNILLDVNFVSKLGDFGISRLIQQSDTNSTVFHMTYNPVGTPGYMDPDYVYTGKLTEKSDVFAFGVIILRLLTGEPASGIVFRVQKAIQNEILHKMIDVSAGNWPFEQAKELALLALRCVEMKRSDRPNLFNEIWPIVENLRRNML